MRLWIIGFAQKNESVDIILGDLCTKLLLPAKGTSQIFMDVQICNFLNQPSGSSGCIQIVLTQDSSVSNAENSASMFFFGIMCYQPYIHDFHSLLIFFPAVIQHSVRVRYQYKRLTREVRP